MSDRIRIALVDDHPMLREGVAHILGAEADMEIIAQGGSAADALRIARDELPDVILLDVSMPGGGIEAARRIAETCPVVKIAMLTVAEDEQSVSAALRAGAHGYVLKGVSGPDLVRMVRAIHAGENYVSPTLAARLLSELRSGPPSPALQDTISDLSSREEQILSLVAEGLSNREVGTKLSISEKTVKHYMTNIMQKLQVRNRVEAALLARRRSAGKSSS